MEHADFNFKEALAELHVDRLESIVRSVASKGWTDILSRVLTEMPQMHIASSINGKIGALCLLNALMRTAEHGKSDCLGLLLATGVADVHQTSRNYFFEDYSAVTAFTLACRQGHRHCAQMLMDHPTFDLAKEPLTEGDVMYYCAKHKFPFTSRLLAAMSSKHIPRDRTPRWSLRLLGMCGEGVDEPHQRSCGVDLDVVTKLLGTRNDGNTEHRNVRVILINDTEVFTLKDVIEEYGARPISYVHKVLGVRCSEKA